MVDLTIGLWTAVYVNLPKAAHLQRVLLRHPNTKLSSTARLIPLP